jgi:tetratricopeptide (TPR) repeat protein
MAKTATIEAEARDERAAGAAKGRFPVAWGALILILATLVVYARSATFDFVHWDDHIHVYQNPYVNALSTANLKHLWSTPYEELYIPLSYTVYAVIEHFARLPHFDKSITIVPTAINPHPFHAANVAFHVLNVLLVFALLRKLLSVRGVPPAATTGPALAGTLVFALHPIQVESVAWISELRGLLCAFFSLAAVFAYLCAVSDPRSRDVDVPVRRWTFWAALVLFALGGLCKPSTVALALAVAAIDRWAVGRPLRSSILSALPFVLIALPLIWRTHGAQPVPDRILVPWWTHPFIAGDALAFYLGKLVVPWGLTIDYGRKPQLVTGNWWGYLTWLVPAAVAYAAYRRRKSAPLAVVACFFSLAMLLPVLGLLPFIYQDYSTVADRYAYLAMIGPALVVSMLVASSRRPSMAYGIFGAVLPVMCALTSIQVGHWKDSFTLFSYAVEMNPNGYQMREDYGIALKEQGKLDDALAQFDKGIQIEPGYSRLYNDMGLVLFQRGDYDGSIKQFQLCVDREPGFADGHRDLGVALMQVGQLDAALPELKRATELEPLEASCHNDYANALLSANQASAAVDEYRAALSIDPSMPEALYGLANAQSASADAAGAEQSARRAVALVPNVSRAHGALARALDAEGKLTESVAEYRQAISLDPNDPTMHFNLACAYFNHGDRTDAIPELQQAQSLQPSPTYCDALGMAYLLNGDKANARAWFERELQLNPNAATARQQLAQLGG